MDFTRPSQSAASTNRSPLISGAPKNNQKPVASAKAAINAMFAERANQAQPAVIASAREAVNAAAKQDGEKFTKSASNLHHGSIQRSMESTRTSASALLRRAGENDNPKIIYSSNSADPLAKVKPASVQKRPEREVPVVRTSLKLGASARPKPAPVVLPPNSRMAKEAHPVEAVVLDKTPKSGKIAKFLRLGAADIGAAHSGISEGTKAKALTSGEAEIVAPADKAVTVNVVSSEAEVAPPSPAKRKPNPIRDPQMRGGAGRRPVGVRANAAQNLAGRAQAAEVLGMATTGSARFRAKPRGFSAPHPAPIPAANSYIMSEPPKFGARKKPSADEDLGVIESYHPSNPPQPIPDQPLGDRAPTGNLRAQKVASGHVSAPRPAAAKSPTSAASAIAAAANAALHPSRTAAAPELPTIKAENTSNYSFSRRQTTAPDNNRAVLGGESPFLKSVNVEKRPLSDNPLKFNPQVPRSASRDAASKSDEKSARTGRKNRYAKKSAEKSPRDLPMRPTVIVPSSHRSSAPLFFLIVITVVLGFAVGAATYLCFFQQL